GVPGQRHAHTASPEKGGNTLGEPKCQGTLRADAGHTQPCVTSAVTGVDHDVVVGDEARRAFGPERDHQPEAAPVRHLIDGVSRAVHELHANVGASSRRRYGGVEEVVAIDWLKPELDIGTLEVDLQRVDG